MQGAVLNQPMGYSYLEAKYEGLSRRLPRLPLGDFPTPISKLDERLWIKRDDFTHIVYGGNKLRKLEYLLGDANVRGCDGVVTFGGVGSNHALATALHSRNVDLDCTCVLMRQRMTDFVETTLQRHQRNATALVAWPDNRAGRVAQMRGLRDAMPQSLAVLPLGGTSPLGSIGYVNAAFELAAQWREATPPERIYVAAGTMGTAAGLAVGLDLLGWPTRVIAVRVTAKSQVNRRAMDKLCAKISRRLHQADGTIAYRPTAAQRVDIRDSFFGDDYAHATAESIAAVAHAKQAWSLPLETTYTGKAMACLLDDLRTTQSQSPWLFWHTYNGRPAGYRPALNDDYSAFLSLCSSD